MPDWQVSQAVSFVAKYIAEQRAVYSAKATSLKPDHRSAMLPFFPADILDAVRVVRGRVTEPSFYPMLKLMGIRNPPAFSEMAGITLQDVVVHSEDLTECLLFHELVHVVQYKQLGLAGFAERYVRGFLSGVSYEEIPLEKQAYALEARFVRSPKEIFSVEHEVQRSLQSDSL